MSDPQSRFLLQRRGKYPLEAVRELIGIALVHRDLDNGSAISTVEVGLHPDEVVVSNPGGLYGITVDRLGRPGTSSPRNAPGQHRFWWSNGSRPWTFARRTTVAAAPLPIAVGRPVRVIR